MSRPEFMQAMASHHRSYTQIHNAYSSVLSKAEDLLNLIEGIDLQNAQNNSTDAAQRAQMNEARYRTSQMAGNIGSSYKRRKKAGAAEATANRWDLQHREGRTELAYILSSKTRVVTQLLSELQQAENSHATLVQSMQQTDVQGPEEIRDFVRAAELINAVKPLMFDLKARLMLLGKVGKAFKIADVAERAKALKTISYEHCGLFGKNNLSNLVETEIKAHLDPNFTPEWVKTEAQPPNTIGLFYSISGGN